MRSAAAGRAVARQPCGRGARLITVLLLAGVVALGGCATRPRDTTRDPFEAFNRATARFNEAVDAALLKPVATAYQQITPPLVRTGVSNFFGNVSDFWSLTNTLLQFKFPEAGDNLMRVLVNTFFGLGGVLDVAGELRIERHREDFGQTLGRWGLTTGPYLVLPFYGPSTLRDTLAFGVETRADVVRNLSDVPTRNSLSVLRAVEARANLLRASAVLEAAALDKYTFTRDAFLARRRSEIFDGEPPEDQLDAKPPE